jgi:hypothetical protein
VERLSTIAPKGFANWHDAWARISAITCGALDALREEAHAGLPIP